MDALIQSHIYLGYFLLILGGFAASQTKLNQHSWQRLLVGLFFIIVWLMGLEGIAIGIYRHALAPSIFQIVTAVGLIFATIGLLALVGRLEGFKGKSRHYWYINGLGGSLITTYSASLFFVALQFFPDFYRANIIWVTVVFIAVPVLLGRQFIAHFSQEPKPQG